MSFYEMKQLYARRDRSVMRVFRPDWAGDQFETMDLLEFDKFQGFLKKFNMEIFVLEDDQEPVEED